jgi:hypothetical protein
MSIPPEVVRARPALRDFVGHEVVIVLCPSAFALAAADSPGTRLMTMAITAEGFGR